MIDFFIAFVALVALGGGALLLGLRSGYRAVERLHDPVYRFHGGKRDERR